MSPSCDAPGDYHEILISHSTPNTYIRVYQPAASDYFTNRLADSDVDNSDLKGSVNGAQESIGDDSQLMTPAPVRLFSEPFMLYISRAKR